MFFKINVSLMLLDLIEDKNYKLDKDKSVLLLK